MYHVEVQGGHRRNHCWWYELRVGVVTFRVPSTYCWRSISMMYTGVKRKEIRRYAPFPFRFRHLLPQSGAVQGFEKFKRAEQIF